MSTSEKLQKLRELGVSETTILRELDDLHETYRKRKARSDAKKERDAVSSQKKNALDNMAIANARVYVQNYERYLKGESITCIAESIGLTCSAVQTHVRNVRSCLAGSRDAKHRFIRKVLRERGLLA